MFNKRLLHKDWNLRRDRPGPLLRKQSKLGNGSGKSVEAVSSERRKMEKVFARQKANFVRVFKIQRGNAADQRWNETVEIKGFGSGPLSPSVPCKPF